MARMEDEATWPLGHLLPVRRPVGALFPELGLLVKGCGPLLHKLSLHEATARGLRLCEKERFASFAALKAAGWEVD